MERDGAEQLAALDRAHVQLLPLTERLHLEQRDAVSSIIKVRRRVAVRLPSSARYCRQVPASVIITSLLLCVAW